MEYHVTGFPKAEFARLWDMVLIARKGIHIPFRVSPLYRVSDRAEDFCEEDRPAIAKDEYVGLYYHDGQIWLKPGEPFHEMQDTVLHELAHHEVPGEAHGPTWRKVFGTAYALYLRESGHAWNAIDHRIHLQVVKRYRVFRKIKGPADQRRILHEETDWIMRHAMNRIPTLTEMGRRT